MSWAIKKRLGQFSNFVGQRKYLFILFYYFAILFQFMLIESVITESNVRLWIDCPLDEYVPFLSIFVIPYLLWFPYIAATLTAVSIKGSRTEFLKFCLSLYAGMTLCFIIYLLVPNGQMLRVTIAPDDPNIFSRAVGMLYKNDTYTNVCPSIHVINSMVTNFAVQETEYFKDKPLIRHASNILNILIIASTVFTKQHSVVDLAAGLAVSLLMHSVVCAWVGRKPKNHAAI